MSLEDNSNQVELFEKFLHYFTEAEVHQYNNWPVTTVGKLTANVQKVFFIFYTTC